MSATHPSPDCFRLKLLWIGWPGWPVWWQQEARHKRARTIRETADRRVTESRSSRLSRPVWSDLRVRLAYLSVKKRNMSFGGRMKNLPQEDVFQMKKGLVKSSKHSESQHHPGTFLIIAPSVSFHCSLTRYCPLPLPNYNPSFVHFSLKEEKTWPVSKTKPTLVFSLREYADRWNVSTR